MFCHLDVINSSNAKKNPEENETQNQSENNLSGRILSYLSRLVF